MEAFTSFIGLAFAGIIIGMFSGLLGIGGGTVMVPTLRLVFGLSAYASTATSLFTMVFTSISGTVSHIQQKTSIPLLGVVLGLGGAVTSALGVYLNSISPSWAIMLATALIIGYSAYNMISKAMKLPKGHWNLPGRQRAAQQPAAGGDAAADGSAPVAGAPQGEGDSAAADGGAAPADEPAASAGGSAPAAPAAKQQLPPDIRDFHYTFTPARVAGAIGAGLIAGMSAGYIGVGGGFIMVPLMTAFLGVPMRLASGTSLLAIIILAIPGIAEQIMLGNVNFMAGIALAVGSIPGAVIGARFVKWIPERQLRLIFAAFLIVAAIALVANELALF